MKVLILFDTTSPLVYETILHLLDKKSQVYVLARYEFLAKKFLGVNVVNKGTFALLDKILVVNSYINGYSLGFLSKTSLNRPLYTFPGNVFSFVHKGNNFLISTHSAEPLLDLSLFDIRCSI